MININLYLLSYNETFTMSLSQFTIHTANVYFLQQQQKKGTLSARSVWGTNQLLNSCSYWTVTDLLQYISLYVI